jgi:hypothetical protein
LYNCHIDIAVASWSGNASKEKKNFKRIEAANSPELSGAGTDLIFFLHFVNDGGMSSRLLMVR